VCNDRKYWLKNIRSIFTIEEKYSVIAEMEQAVVEIESAILE